MSNEHIISFEIISKRQTALLNNKLSQIYSQIRKDLQKRKKTRSKLQENKKKNFA